MAGPDHCKNITVVGKHGKCLWPAGAPWQPRWPCRASSEGAWSIYDHPQLYEAAFCTGRDFVKETDFLYEICDRHSDEEPISMLDVGCGPGNHSLEMAKKGLAVTSIDNSSFQLEYARKKAKDSNLQIRFLQQDFRDVHLPEKMVPVDLAIMLFGNMQHLHTITDIQRCWSSISGCLKPGGILILELPHYEEVFNGQITEPMYWESSPDSQEGTVIVEWGTEDDDFDAEAQVLRRRLGVSVRKGSQINLQGEQYVFQRIFTYQELLCHAQATGFDAVACYGDLDSQVDALHVEAQRMVLVLKKQQT